MRIAILAPPYLPVPPKQYGGTERIVSLLTEELVVRGHDVTLFASGDSVTSARLVSPVGNALGNDGTQKGSALLPLLHYSDCFRREKDFDFIHSHAQYLGLFLAEKSAVPVVHTWHGSFYEGEVPEEKRRVLQVFQNQNFVSISKSQQEGMPHLHYIGNVYNGLSLQAYPFVEKPKGTYLLWVGRIVEKKGPLTAIRVAQKIQMPLIMAGAIDPIDRPYFEEVIQPHIDGSHVVFHGELEEKELVSLYGNAMATLYPITWHEPFGLVMIESLACGTPVIAYDRGSVSEVIQDGKTGVIVPIEQGIEGLMNAVSSIQRISRMDCRTSVESRFTIGRMVDSYEKIYNHLV